MSTIESAFLKQEKSDKKPAADKDDASEKDVSKQNSRAYSNVSTPNTGENSAPVMKEAEQKQDNEPKQENSPPIQKPEVSAPKTAVSSAKSNIATMSQERVFSAKELNDKGLLSSDSSNLNLVNEYRNLRTRLLSRSHANNFVTLVTSVKANQDTSLVAANLAATFALDSGKTSLLLNADSNVNNKLDKIFEVESRIGLVDFIESDDMAVDEIIYETPLPRLRYIPIGNHAAESGEYFTSSRMKSTMDSLLTRYPERYPIINAPSIASSADTRILLDLCDTVILVVPYGECSEEIIKQAALAVGTEKFAGVVLDNF